ncbi:MAG TPA: NAD-dependent epimerase/dehydratase family protein [Actinomycetes bacterium]|jgi:nucleoside-diphosphate-sugar epimerase|nr:NAD-dependent epimerase/dehydratase family protein [Actinomycetes bacterium]
MPRNRREHVVVTGAAGFIGSHLAEALLDQGRDVVGVDAFTGQVPPAERWANLSSLLVRPGFELHRLDLATADIESLLTGAAAVFHLAAQPGVRTSFGPAFSGYLHDNVLATQRLLESCVRAEIPRLIFASSSSVYGDAPSYPTTEESRTRPLSPYGVTKLAAEQLCHAYAHPRLSSMTVAILRYFTVYGPRQRPDMGFRRFIEAALAGRPIVVYGDGRQTRDFAYVDDVVRANLLAMTAPVEGEPVNIGGGRRISLHEALELVGMATGRPLRIDRRPPRPGDARHTGADGTRAEALLGYRPETDLATGLAAQVAWVSQRQQATTG